MATIRQIVFVQGVCFNGTKLSHHYYEVKKIDWQIRMGTN